MIYINIFINIAPPLTLVITANGLRIEGETYSLTCDLMGDELLAVSVRTVRWDRLTPSLQMGIHHVATLTFDSLSSQDEGEYRCVTTITSPYLTSDQTPTQTVALSVLCK